jgi:pyrimidine-nucleoside phosphorylase
MQILDIIQKKRSGGVLSAGEVRFFIQGYVADEIPDYQIAALLMAIFFRGMNQEETRDLTLAMVQSGDTVDLSRIPGIKVDKHSTGGVADTTTLVAVPLVAACGGKVAKMSGRGLGHTGGTLDKLESIPGFSVSQKMEDFERLVSTIGASVIGQTADLVPADKKLYALRDVTGTVDNLSLIASSIMSKKIASGSDAIVLDVKTGSGAFMKELKDSVALARAMVDIGKGVGRKTMALVTDMNQPLGNAVGNALEVQEAIEILSGGHPGALKEAALALASWMLVVSGLDKTPEEARVRLDQALVRGQGLAKLAEIITAQGGNPRVCEDVTLLPQAAEKVSVTADKNTPAAAYVGRMDCQAIGMAALLLGAGRSKKTDVIDPAVGLWIKKRLGDPVKPGEELAVFYVNSKAHAEEAIERFKKAVILTEEKPAPLKLIAEVLV